LRLSYRIDGGGGTSEKCSVLNVEQVLDCPEQIKSLAEEQCEILYSFIYVFVNLYRTPIMTMTNS